MKIVHVIPGLTHERGGPSAVVQALASRQAAAGHEVTVLITDQGARHGERPVPLPAPVRMEQAAVWGPDRVAYAPRFAALVRRRMRGSDLVHVHSLFTHAVHAALREASAAGTPVVLRPCGHLHRYSLRRSRLRKRAYLALFGRFVRRACTCWHFTSEQESTESWPWDSSPRFVLPNGIDPADFPLGRSEARAHLVRAWPQLGGAPYVLFLSRLHPKKRLDVLLEAFLAGAPQEYRLVVAGPDECGLWPALAARYLGSRDAAARVLRVGTVAGNDKAALLAAAALFALPSAHENFGIAALEALAAGTPVLLSPQVDLAAPLLTGDFGQVAPADVPTWAERFAVLLADPAQLAEAGGRARRQVCEQYSWDHIHEELIGRYRWILNGCPTDAVPVGRPMRAAEPVSS